MFQGGFSFVSGFSFNNKFLLGLLYTVYFTLSAYTALKSVSEEIVCPLYRVFRAELVSFPSCGGKETSVGAA